MDDQPMDTAAEALTFGNPDLPEGTPERPLVTFALFAYNQEKYVREAVEGAFSQTYSPLEIILSDDCSSDRTFEIMQEMAREYEGPHRVVVRRGELNLGTLSHILTVSEISRGEVICVAAGDDISLPARVEMLTPRFVDSSAVSGSSSDIIINETGREIFVDPERFSQRLTWHSENPAWIHGATAAYRTDFLRLLPCPENSVLFEDMVFSELLRACRKESFYIQDKLVKYRYHNANQSSRHEKSVADSERALMDRWARTAEVMEYCAGALKTICEDTENLHDHANALVESQRLYYLLSRWPDLTMKDKIRLLVIAYRQQCTKTALIRVFGFSLFRKIRFVLNKLAPN